MSNSEYSFTYPSVLESENRFYRDMMSIPEIRQMTTDCRHGVLLVISEAFTNALEHGNRFDANKIIKVSLMVTELDIVADIVDEGEMGLERLDHKEPSNWMAEDGRGLALIRHYADDVHYSHADGGGLKVTVRFSRKDKKIGQT